MGDFKARAVSDEKKKYMRYVFNKEEINIATPHFINATTPNGLHVQLVEVATSDLTNDVKERFLDILCERNPSILREEIREELERGGYMIRAEGLVLSIEHPQRWI